MNVSSGQTFTLAEAELLFDSTPRSEQWYVSDNSQSGEGAAVGTDAAPDGWIVAYDIPSATFTVTVSSNPAYQGRSFHAGFRDGPAPSNNYWISSDFTVVAPPPPPSPLTLTATPQIVAGVPSILLSWTGG